MAWSKFARAVAPWGESTCRKQLIIFTTGCASERFTLFFCSEKAPALSRLRRCLAAEDAAFETSYVTPYDKTALK